MIRTTDEQHGAASPHGWQSLGSVRGHRREGDSICFECDSGALRVWPMADGIVRVRLERPGEAVREHSWSVLPDRTAGHWQVEDRGEAIEIDCGELRIRVQRDPCRIQFIDSAGRMLAADDASKGIAWDGEEVCCWKTLAEGDHFFGLGEKSGPLDKRGQTLVNWNTDDPDHAPWSDPLYQSHPFLLILRDGRAHGLFFDNAHRSHFDLGRAGRRAYAFGAEGGAMNYYFIAGPAPADVLRRYASLVGTTPLPPRWALGFQQCRWSYESAKRVRKLAREFRRRKVPCDTIYIDIDYMDGYRCFTWHPQRFADPPRLMRELSEKGFKVVAILDPGIKAEPGYWVFDEGAKHFCRDEAGKLYVGKVWPGESVFPDFTSPAAREWWGGLYRGLLSDGVTGFWNDMNEPADFSQPQPHYTLPLGVRHDNDGEPTDHAAVHNVYGMQMARATFEGLRRLRPAERPFVLTRAGFSGVQRYAAVWTGDNLSSWEHLRLSIPMLLNMSLSGITFCGADIGGFREHPTPELFTRWLQLGIFYPLCRVHTAGGPDQEPWSHGAKHEKHNRAAIELRYQLLPYLYTQMRRAAQTGMPVLRPVLFESPMAANGHKIDREFFFGPSLFVAPVLDEGAKRRKVTFPEGEWCDFDDGAARPGSKEHELPVKLGTIPLFARAGAVIPMARVTQHTQPGPLREVILRIYPGEGGGEFYNDDGLSYEYESGRFAREEYETRMSMSLTTLRLVRREGSSEFAAQRYVLQFVGVRRAPAAVAAGGVPLAQRRRGKFNHKQVGAWCYDAGRRQVLVCIRPLAAGETVEILHRTRGGAAKGQEPASSLPA